MRVLGVNAARRVFTRGAWRTQTSWWPAAARRRTSSSCWQATRTGRPGICSGKLRAATGGSSQLPPTLFCHLCEVCPCNAPSCSLAILSFREQRQGRRLHSRHAVAHLESMAFICALLALYTWHCTQAYDSFVRCLLECKLILFACALACFFLDLLVYGGHCRCC
jgi:hypothetical protein